MKSIIIDLLNDLMTANRDIIKVYQTAVDRLEDQMNIGILQGYIQQHDAFVSELSNLVEKHHGTAVSSPDFSSLVKRAWVTVKAAVTEGDGPLVNTVAQDAENMLEAYGEAYAKVMELETVDDIRDIIRSQMSEIRVAHQKLEALSTAYSG